ncbi:homocysteine S-methyltransferase family protein [Oceanisphaera psychrotolerans]|uniref:Homocysteine methyltransferase n=1 Tax=Oceanisphaera psychrotolerans TaxID=1414654 RepID=A0A1J4QA02_9GAMM|nr:homocysteine S-methyltransferase family protein [Oceanisphaera psychrotolerans]OIN04326.1 homocysteine methyltransferase [Oceanisphaera psychrotolerans]
MKIEPNIPIIMDGGMGRELKRIGAPFKQPEWSAQALIEAPQFVSQAHEHFLAAGAEVITTNTYALVPFHIGAERFNASGSQLIKRAAGLARDCAKHYPAASVAGCIPPVLGSYRPDLFSSAAAQPLIDAMIENQNEYVDFWLAETVSCLAEAELIANRVLPTDKALWMAFTIQDEPDGAPRLRSGEKVFDVVRQLDKTRISAILFNCSRAEVMEQAIVTARRSLTESGDEQHIRLGAYANSFSPIGHEHQANNGLCALREELTPQAYRDFARSWIQAGASIIGGCCGITPAHIKELTTLREN